jgi:succinyl-CoA synthetase beta subunit
MGLINIRSDYSKAIFNNNNNLTQVSPAVLAEGETVAWKAILDKYPWLNTEKLVVKPDQLIKRRGKAGLIKVGCNLEECKIDIGRQSRAHQGWLQFGGV